MVSGRSIDPNDARAYLGTLGSSLLVVGGADLLRVHLHTTQPDDALAYGRSLGELTQVKVDNLEAQIESWLAKESTPAPVASGVGIVAVASGEGLGQAFRSVGVTHLVEGGQTMNPSAGEILEAIESCAEPAVVVLPNNKNIIAAARQAAEQSTKRVAVIPTRSIPQGVAALLALNPDSPFEENTAAMKRALASVRSAEVTRAVRATTIDGQAIAIGQAIGIVDGKLRVVADDIPSAVRGCVEEMRSDQSSLLTLYPGRDVRDEDAAALADELGTRYAGVQIELVPGGQPYYHYILSLE
jgi:dihydroxyacetone kinase-like predicted kinase